MNNFICPDLSQIICQLLGIESSWKLTIDSLKRKTQRSNVCTFTDIAKLGEVHQGYQNQVVSQELKTTKKESVTYLVSKPYNYFGRPQNRKVNQQETKILKFSLSLLLFPFPDFRWMFQFSFSYFARQRSCFSFLRGKLVRSRSELIPLRMPKGWPLFSFASVFRISQGGT